jgi:hypothetical protein
MELVDADWMLVGVGILGVRESLFPHALVSRLET